MALIRFAHYHDHGYAVTERYIRCRESKCTDPTPIFDRWLCTNRTKVRNEPRYESCKQEYWWPRLKPGVVGGPRTRMLDRRYGYAAWYKCKHVKSGGLLRHESAPDPEQPVQDPALFEQIEHLKVVAKEARKKRGRKKDPAAPGEGVRPA